MNKLILINLILLGVFTISTAQDMADLPKIQQMVPRKSDEVAKFYEVKSYPYASSPKTTITEIDLNKSEYQHFDSLVDWYGNMYSITNVFYDLVLHRKVVAYTADYNATGERVRIKLKDLRSKLEDAKKTPLRKILMLESYVFDTAHCMTFVKTLAIAPLAKKTDGAFEPFFWVMYEDISPRFSKYKLTDSTNKRVLLTEFFRWHDFHTQVIEPDVRCKRIGYFRL